MKSKTGVTKTEVAVVLGCCVFLMLIIVGNFIYKKSHELGYRPVCLDNLKRLALAWVMYADDNDGDLVNGMAGIDRVDNSTSPPTILERAWIGPIPLDNGNPMIDNRTQEQIIRNGALWEYAKNPMVFRCPAGKVNHLLTYQIVDSMNGFQQPDTVAEGVWANKREELSRPGNRIVFIDVGEVKSSSYYVTYRDAKWLDMPPVRHRNGTNVCFADTHTELWKWKGEETIRLGKRAAPKHLHQHVEPKTVDGKYDLQKLQWMVWKMGYKPSASK